MKIYTHTHNKKEKKKDEEPEKIVNMQTEETKGVNRTTAEISKRADEMPPP